MAVAGFKGKVSVSTDGGSTYNDIIGLNDASLSLGGTVLDDTEFINNAGYRSQFYGLRDATVSLSGDFSTTTADHQEEFLHAWLQDSTGEGYSQLQVQYYPDKGGSYSLEIPVVVSSLDISGSVDDKQTISIELTSDGSITLNT